MKDGELVESGTHQELMEKNGEYAVLYGIQAQAFEPEKAQEEDGETGVLQGTA